MKIKAERLDTGHYRYRGFDIQDHGSGNSVNSAMNRNAWRWKIRRIIGPGFFNSEYVDAAWTLNEAKKIVDRLFDKVEAA